MKLNGVYGCKETILKSPVEGGGEVELQMPLPAMPTSYAVAFLLLDARKYTESGIYVLDRAGLQLFAWQLSEKVLDIVENQKYLGFLLASVGRWKLSTAKSDPGHEKRVVSVLSKLQSCLDPIDWAILLCTCLQLLSGADEISGGSLQLIPAIQQQVDPTSTGTNYFILSEFLSEFLSKTPWKKLFHGVRVNLLGPVGTKFNKGTSKLGSILSDSLVGCLKDKSAGAISTFSYTLPVWAAGLSSPAQAKSPNLFCAESHTMNSWKGRDLPAKGVWQGFIPKEASPPGSSFCSSFILYTKGLPLDVVKNFKISKGFITTLEIE